MTTFLRRPWVRRLLRVTIWTFATLLSLLALLYGVLHWKGSHAMQHALARLQAEGETIELSQLLPPPVDERLNFGAIPALRDIAKPNADSDVATTRRREALSSLTIKNQNPQPWHAVMLAEPSDLKEWAKVSAEALQLSPNADAAALRHALEKKFPLITELATAAAQRPQCEFTPAMVQRELPSNLFALEVPHYNGVMQSSRTITLHALVCTATDDFDAAVADVRVLSRFATAMQREPMLISLLVSASIQSMAHEAVWHLLRSGKLTDAQVQSLQKELATSLEPAALYALRGELAMAGSTMMHAKDLSSSERSAFFTIISSSDYTRPGAFPGVLLPNGYFGLAGAHLIEAELDHLVLPMKHGGFNAILRAGDEFERKLKVYQEHPFQHLDAMLTRMAMPAMRSVALRLISTECHRRQALIACALERWKLRHGGYPAALSELVPAELSAVEADPLDGQPMRYRTTDDGRYALWSVALDQKDDGGKVTRSPNLNPASDYLKQNYQGDWTWQYQVVK